MNGDIYENKIKQILDNLESMDYLISNRSRLNVEDFISTLTNLCLFQLSYIDRLKILSNIFNKIYVYENEINTTMYIDHINDCLYGINYYVACTRDSGINKYNIHNYYDGKTITELVENKEIIILDEIEKELWSDTDTKIRTEDYKSITQFSVCNKNYNNNWYYKLSEYLLSDNVIYKEYLYKYVRNHVRKYMLEKEMKNYLSALNSDINYIYSRSNDLYFGVTPCVEFTRECTSLIKEKGYSKRLKKLTDKYC